MSKNISNGVKSYRLRERFHEDLVPDLLEARGLSGEVETARFLNPDFERDSHDPFLLPGIERAVERILFGLSRNERIAVWSDYDADGIPAGVMLSEFFRDMGLSVRHYIPHRHKEGYGLNQEGLAELAEEGITLVITADLGTTDVEPIAFAKQKGIDVIVTDHHLEPPTLPEAHAIVNPKLKTSQYPFSDLCGAGVAWKLVQALLLKKRPEGFAEGREKWFLDLVGIGTLSDMVPLVGENRMLAHFGLLVMRRGRRPGLSALLSLLRIRPAALSEDDIGFMVSPRINAASRMDSPQVAAELLGAKDATQAKTLALKLNKINDERKGIVAATVKEANRRLKELTNDSPVIVMGSPSWRPGILGLVANKLAETHAKSVCLWGREGGEVLRGSCRSSGDVHIIEWMRAAGDIFEDFGGHAGSGGFSLRQERAHELPARLAEAYERVHAKESIEKEVLVDRELPLAEVPHAHRGLRQLAPFGIGNEKPLFIIPQVTLDTVRTFGKAEDHLGFSFSSGEARGEGIAFFSSPHSFTKEPQSGKKTDIVGYVESDWRGGPRVRVVDTI